MSRPVAFGVSFRRLATVARPAGCRGVQDRPSSRDAMKLVAAGRRWQATSDFHQGRISRRGLSGLGRLTFDHAGAILWSNSSWASFRCLSLSLGPMGMYLLAGRSITLP